MAGGGGGGGQPGDNDDGKYLIFFILFVIAGWVIWVVLKPQFLWVAFGMDLLQYKFLDAIGLLDDRGRRWMTYALGVMQGVSTPLNVPLNYRPTNVTWDNLLTAQGEIGSRMVYFWLFVGSVLCLTVLFRMRGDGFKRQYTLTGRSKSTVFRFMGMRVENKWAQFLLWWGTKLTFTNKLVTRKKEWINQGASFSMYQARHWREALTGAMFDPNANEPSMRPQMTPPEWLRANNIGLVNGTLDRDGVTKALQLQCGFQWTSLTAAPLHVQAIMIMSALNVKRDPGLNKLRANLTEVYTLRPSKVAQEVPKLLAPFLADAKVVRRITQYAAPHAYHNTACIAVYGWGGPIESWGGKGAVLSTSLFLWLKRVDRPLWYALNNVGRRAYHVEGAGSVCHFFVERLHRAPVIEHSVDNAYQGIVKYLAENHINDLETFFNVERDF